MYNCCANFQVESEAVLLMETCVCMIVNIFSVSAILQLHIIMRV